MFHFHPGLLLRTTAFPYTAYATADRQQLLQQSYFREALRLASPVLYQVLQSKDFKYDQLPPKARHSLQKYLNRMCFRPTPFGLFSGFALARWGTEGGQPFVLEKTAGKVHYALAFSQVLKLTGELLSEELAPYLRYYPNATLYKVGGEYRYIRYAEQAHVNRRSFFIDSIGCGKLLDAVMRICAKGQTRTELIAFVAQQAQAEIAESTAYVEQLITEQVLEPELGVNITGEAYVQRLLAACAERGVVTGRTRRLHVLLEQLHLLNLTKENTGLASTEQLGLPDRGIYANLQVGLREGQLCSTYQEKIREGLVCLLRLVPRAEPNDLKAFATAFRKKFDRRVVPLLDALDPEIGVGYGQLAVSHQSPKLLEELTFAAPDAEKSPLTWTPAHALLLEKWQAAGPYPAVVQLTTQDLDRLPGSDKETTLPPSMAVLFRVLGEQVYLEQAGGVSATALLGRFTPLDPGVQTMAKEIALAEESANPQVVFAEIAHVCDPQTANIDRRASIRSYEIPVLAGSTLPEERQIHPSELWVRVEGDTVVLWSERLQKIVVPRLGSAFNYVRDDLAVFRFLCDLQYQGLRSNFSLNLSRFFPDLSYYPRVVYRGAILQLASWHLSQEQLEELYRGGIAGLKSLASALKWPRHLALTQNDQQLVIDLERETDQLLLLEHLKGKTAVELREFPFLQDDQPVVTDEAGEPHVHQFLAAALHTQEVYKPRPITAPADRAKKLKRKLLPGSKWLYLKVYCHPSRSNSLLTETLQPLCLSLVREGAVTQWFFVRYRDPEYHLRLRLCLAEEAETTGTILAIHNKKLEKLVQQGVVADVQVGTYERELERYQPHLIEAVERVFCTSSALVSAYLSKAPFSENEYGYYSIVFQGMRNILDAFGLDLSKKAGLLGRLYFAFFEEFQGTKELKAQLAAKYREIGQEPGVLPCAERNPLLSGLRLGRLQQAFEDSLRDLAKQASSLSALEKERLVADLLHMHLNRILTDQAREQELVLYYGLWRHYTSVAARQRSEV